MEEYAHRLEEQHSEQGIEELSGQALGKNLLQQIKNTKKIEATAKQLSQDFDAATIERSALE